jgi:hypothetical protein
MQGRSIHPDDPNEIVKVLKENHKLKLKGVGPLTYHLVCDTSKIKMVHCVMVQGNISQR